MNMNTETAAVLFDMDGVVVDSEQYWIKYETEELFPEIVEESVVIEEIIGMNVEDIYAYLDREYTVSVDRAAFLGLYDEIARQVYAAADPMPRFEELLGSIEAPVGLVTSSPHRWIDIVFERFDLQNAFDVIVSAADVERGKPAPDVYQRAVSALDVEATACLAIEDSTNGILAASRADMSVIAYGDPSEKAISNADAVTNTSSELLTMLREL